MVLFSIIIVFGARLFSEILAGLIGLILCLPSLAVGVRRFHDLDKSGWFILLGFIPIVGNVIVLVLMGRREITVLEKSLKRMNVSSRSKE